MGMGDRKEGGGGGLSKTKDLWESFLKTSKFSLKVVSLFYFKI